MLSLSGILYSLYGYVVDRSGRGNACAVLAPGQLPNKPAVYINDFHCAAGTFHEVLHRKTAKQQAVVLEGELLECRGWSMAKGLRKGIKQSTHTNREEAQDNFVDLSGPRVVESLGRKQYTLNVRDIFSRYPWVYYMRHKSDAAALFEQFLACSRAGGVTSTVVIVRSDGGGEIRGD